MMQTFAFALTLTLSMSSLCIQDDYAEKDSLAQKIEVRLMQKFRLIFFYR